MLKLIKNEIIKILYQRSNQIMIVILVLMTFISSLMMRVYGVRKFENLWGTVQDQSWLILLVIIFSVVAAGSVVANEFAWGTIKLLLIRPVKRWQILLAKYLAVILFSVLLMVLLFGSAYVINLLLYGFKRSGEGYLFGQVGGKGLSSIFTVARYYFLRYFEVLIYITMAFMLSAVFRSSAMAIGVTLIALFLGPQFTDIFSDYQWSKYLLFPNTDLTKYIGVSSANLGGMSLEFSLSVLGVYFVIFNLLSWTFFIKRDVAS